MAIINLIDMGIIHKTGSILVSLFLLLFSFVVPIEWLREGNTSWASMYSNKFIFGILLAKRWSQLKFSYLRAMKLFGLKHFTLIIHTCMMRFLSLNQKWDGIEILFLGKFEGKDSINLQFQYRLGKPSGSRFFCCAERLICAKWLASFYGL